jgi:hypothetical protein
MASLALLFRRRSLCPASRRRQLRFAPSNSEIAWNLRVQPETHNKRTFRARTYQFDSKVATPNTTFHGQWSTYIVELN